MFTGRNQTFNQLFRVFWYSHGSSRSSLPSARLSGCWAILVAHLQRFSRRRGKFARTIVVVWSGASPPARALGDRLKDAQTNAFAFHSTNDAGLTLVADAGSGEDQHNNTGHGLSLSLPAVFWGRVTKQHRSEAGGREIRQSDWLASCAITSSSLVGIASPDGTFFVDETDLPKRAAEVTFVVDFKAQHAQFARRFADRRSVFCFAGEHDCIERPSIRR